MSGIMHWLEIMNGPGVQYCFWLSLATLIYTYYLEKRRHGWLLAGVCMTGSLILGILFPPLNQSAAPVMDMIWYIAAYVINVCIIFSYCRITIWEALTCAMYAALTEHLASSVFILKYVGRWSWSVTYVVISLTVYSAIWFLVARKIADKGHYHVKAEPTILFSVLVELVLVVLSYMCKYTADPSAMMQFESETVRRMLQLSQWYAIAFCSIMLAVELTHQQRIKMQLDLSASHELLRIHEQQYHLTCENIELINRKCHDMKHQVMLLMEQQGGSEELRRRYGQEIIKMIEIYDTNINTGNEVLNTILRSKSLYCSMNGITWTCSAHGAELGFMDPMDIAALISNALDNAVEAVERIPDRKQQIINVQIAPIGNMVQILIENTFDGKLNRVNGQLLTRKQEQEYHGIGIRSMIATAEKYGGYASTDAQGNTFVLNILIPIPDDEKNTERKQDHDRS